MSITSRRQIRYKQVQKRRLKRKKIVAKGMDPAKFYHEKYFIGQKEG